MSLPSFDENNYPVELPTDLTSDELSQVHAVTAQVDTTGRHLARTAIAIGGAFMLYRAYMKRRLKEKLRKEEQLAAKDYAGIIQETFNTFMPAWTYMVTPAIFSAYLSGVEIVGQSMSSQALRQLAQRYSWNLGEYLNGKSIDSAIRGYQAQLNRNINAKIALANTIDAFAVPLPGIRSLVAVWTGKDEVRPSEALLPSVKRARINRQINAQLSERAKLIGDQESFTAHSTGKQLAWMYAQSIGLIPHNATRQWVTAKDEKVCPQCGPLHGLETPIAEPFQIGKLKIWSPSLHVNCRCTVKLKAHLVRELSTHGFQRLASVKAQAVSEDFSKADWDADEHPRDMRSGRFSTSSRPRRSYTFKQPEELQRYINAAQQQEIQQAAQRNPSAALRPRSTALIRRGPAASIARVQDAALVRNQDAAIVRDSALVRDSSLNRSAALRTTKTPLQQPGAPLKPQPPEPREEPKPEVPRVPVDRLYGIYDEAANDMDVRKPGRRDHGEDMFVDTHGLFMTSDPDDLAEHVEDYRAHVQAELLDRFSVPRNLEPGSYPKAISHMYVIPAPELGEKSFYLIPPSVAESILLTDLEKPSGASVIHGQKLLQYFSPMLYQKQKDFSHNKVPGVFSSVEPISNERIYRDLDMSEIRDRINLIKLVAVDRVPMNAQANLHPSRSGDRYLRGTVSDSYKVVASEHEEVLGHEEEYFVYTLEPVDQPSKTRQGE